MESNLYNRTYELSAYSPAERDDAGHGLLSFDWTGRVLYQKRDGGAHIIHGVPYKRASAYYYRDDTLVQALALYSSERVDESIRGDDLPETWPAFHSLLLDDEDRLWVSRYTGSPDKLDWWVLDSSGELPAEFTWSRHDTFEEVQDGKLYVTSMDTSTFAMSAERYNIEIK